MVQTPRTGNGRSELGRLAGDSQSPRWVVVKVVLQTASVDSLDKHNSIFLSSQGFGLAAGAANLACTPKL